MTLANDVGTPGTKQDCIAHIWHEVAVGGRDVYSQCVEDAMNGHIGK